MCLAARAAPQGIAGVVRDSATGRPISGAVVTVLDSTGAPKARNLTNDGGEYRLSGTNGGRRLRAVRIGFEPREFALPPASGGQVDFRMLSLPNMLQAVRVVANSNCPRRSDAASALGLWQQARAGLLATVVSRQQNPASILRLISQELMDGNSDRVQSMHVQSDSSVDTMSFVAARSGEDFVKFGFRHDSAGVRTNFGPDAIVLLSDDFAAAYCFGLASAGRARPRQVGIHFEPAVSRSDRADIDGTLWVDTAARELRDVEFAYLGVSPLLNVFHPGGTVSFQTMPNGEVLVDRWTIRSVKVTYDTTWETMGGRGFRRNGNGTAGLGDPLGSARTYQVLRPRLQTSVDIGELARASWAGGQVWRAPLGTLRVRAMNARGQPATGAIIELAGTSYRGVVDSTGTAEIAALLPGPYQVTVADPRLAELGTGMPTPLKFIAVRGVTTTKSLSVSNVEDIVAARCAAAHQWTPGDSVFVVGRVVTPGGQPVSNATVWFSSGTYVNPDVATTGDDGLFQSCRHWNLHDIATIVVNGTGIASPPITRSIDSKLQVVRIVVRRTP